MELIAGRMFVNSPDQVELTLLLDAKCHLLGEAETS